MTKARRNIMNTLQGLAKFTPKVLLLVSGLAFISPASAQTASPTAQPPSPTPLIAGITRLNPALDSILAPDAKIELAVTGFGFTEGPVWMKGGYLLFTDIPGNVVYKLQNGKASVFLYNAGYRGADPWRYGGMANNGYDPKDPRYEQFPQTGADGLARDPQGRLIIATFAGRSVVRLEANGKLTVIADNYEGTKFSGPNDVVVKSDGAIYFSDTFAGLRLRGKDPKIEIPYNGLYMWKGGKLSLLLKGDPYLNGLAFSPDETYLYLNGSTSNYVNRCEVKADDTVVNCKLFFDMRSDKRPGQTDGMRIDKAGNVFETGPGGIWIISPEGKLLGMITPPQLCSNLGFGDRDKKTLYMACRTSLYKTSVKIPGL
jgi:gluconolactonase